MYVFAHQRYQNVTVITVSLLSRKVGRFWLVDITQDHSCKDYLLRQHSYWGIIIVIIVKVCNQCILYNTKVVVFFVLYINILILY